MYKYFLYLMLSLVLCISTVSPVTVQAEESDKTAGVAYEIGESYTWVIHSLVDFDDNQSNAVKVTKSIIPEEKLLSITIGNRNTFQAFCEGNSLPYQVFKDGKSLTTGNEILCIKSGSSGDSALLSFRISKNKEISDYVGTISYVATILP